MCDQLNERKVCPMLLPYCTDPHCIEEKCAWWIGYGCVITRAGDAIRSQIEVDKLYDI